MSSQNQESSESARLLGDSGLEASRQSNTASPSRERSLSRERFRISPQTRLIPVLLGAELACQLPTTTYVELVRVTVCKLFHNSTDVSVSFLEGSSPTEHCSEPDIAQYFALAIAVQGIVEGVLWAAGYGLLNHISSHSGRKPALLLVLATGIIGCCLIAGSQFTPGWLVGWLFLLGVLFRMSSGSPLHGYLASLYITDMCTAQDRTRALSKITGWSTLGVSISLALGGFVTTNTGNPLIVFYMAATIFAAVFIYILFFLPESFPQEKRDALAQLQLEHSDDSLQTITRFPLLRVLGPLRPLAPTRRLDGTLNWRLAWCTMHHFIYTTVNAYAPTCWVVLATSKYHLSPAETGLFFSIVTMSGTIALIAIVPPLVDLLRPFYQRKTTRSLTDEEYTPNDGNSDPGTSDDLDVYLTFATCVIAAIGYLSAATSTTSTGVILSGICVGFSYVRFATIRSLVVGSVHPLKQGETVAAFDMVSSVASILSPIIMGGILTATIDSTPLLLFYVHLAVVLFSGVLLFFIRDADRYQTSREA